jgi:hypothetical protein
MVNSKAKDMFVLIYWTASNEVTVMPVADAPDCTTSSDPTQPGQVVPLKNGCEGYFIWPEDNRAYHGKILRINS